MNHATSHSKWKIWLLATRPPTLPAAIVPVFVGSAAAASQGHFQAGVLSAALFSSLFIQIGTNFANDLFDFKKGADTKERLGPTRVTQAGLLTEKQIARGTAVAFLLAVLFGVYLIIRGGWPILAIGVIGIAFGVMYTGGWAFGYRGLGDLFTFLFFGPVAIIGTYYVHVGYMEKLAVIVSIPVGCLVTAILVVNNLRDIETDRKAGKKTLAVRIGESITRWQYMLFVAVAYATPLFLRAEFQRYWIPLLTLPLGVYVVWYIWTKTGRALNKGLKLTGMLHLLFGILFAAALML